jgi:hypothetical protein
MFCRSLFVLLYSFFWPLCCLFFFDLQIIITPLVASNSSSTCLTLRLFLPFSEILIWMSDIYIYQWCGFKSRRGKNKNLTALKSNSNTVWFNFQILILIIYIYKFGIIDHKKIIEFFNVHRHFLYTLILQ